MSLIGNILWFFLGGLISACLYFLFGLLMCITIIGIPFGVQLWKLAYMSLSPFGKNVDFDQTTGCLAMGFNILWVLLGWWEIALVHLIFAIICAVTIIGIPFAKQHLKLAKLSLMPFGMKIK